MRKTLLSLACVLMTATAAAAAPAKVTFWHYFGDEGSTSALNAMAAEFNKSQGKYQVTPVGVGDYKTLNVKLIASLRGGGQPTMALVDNAFFTRLALGGQLAPLDDLMNDLPKAAQSDFYPVLWDYGIAGGKRYGLPWAASTLLLYYNTDLLKARNVAPPKTWAEFASAAKSLTTRASKGAVLICDAWIFGSIVTSRGGSLLTSDNLPNLDSAGTTGTLAFLQEMVRGGNAIARSTTEIEVAVMDFLRTKAAMVIAPSSAWAIANDHAVGFRPGVVPLPGKTLAGEAQLVVLKGAGTEETRGAYEFWKHLTTPKNIVRWSAATGYLPARKSAAADATASGEKGAAIRAGLATLEEAVNLPRIASFNDWRNTLEGSLERVLKGNYDAKQAMVEAQRQALTIAASKSPQ